MCTRKQLQAWCALASWRLHQELTALLASVQALRSSKVWAPSAREMVALEEQVKAMAQQLSSQQQQWQGFLSVAQAQLPSLSGSSQFNASQPRGTVPAGQAYWAPSRGAAADQGAVSGVREKLQFLQGEVEKMIAGAAAMGGGMGEDARPRWATES
jgi:hypothetical protein